MEPLLNQSGHKSEKHEVFVIWESSVTYQIGLVKNLTYTTGSQMPSWERSGGSVERNSFGKDLEQAKGPPPLGSVKDQLRTARFYFLKCPFYGFRPPDKVAFES